MFKRILLWLLARLAKTQENAKAGQIFAIKGQPVFCQACREAVGYPPVRIPLGPPKPGDDAVHDKFGNCLNPEVVYGRFHISCAIKWLTALTARELESTPNTETMQDESDSG